MKTLDDSVRSDPIAASDSRADEDVVLIIWSLKHAPDKGRQLCRFSSFPRVKSVVGPAMGRWVLSTAGATRTPSSNVSQGTRGETPVLRAPWSIRRTDLAMFPSSDHHLSLGFSTSSERTACRLA